MKNARKLNLDKTGKSTIGVSIVEEGTGQGRYAESDELDDLLTPRECEVAQGVFEGLSNKEIARELEISPWTVSSHLRQVFLKLGISRRVELCRIWHQMVDRLRSA